MDYIEKTIEYLKERPRHQATSTLCLNSSAFKELDISEQDFISAIHYLHKEHFIKIKSEKPFGINGRVWLYEFGFRSFDEYVSKETIQKEQKKTKYKDLTSKIIAILMGVIGAISDIAVIYTAFKSK